jgi:diguanylate cyclase (GGDEF)-like protein/PAS domain S-box-containing protein
MSRRCSLATIVLAYAGFAALWIVASDTLLTFSVSDPLLQHWIELAKGLVFVAVTSGLLYFLLNTWHEPERRASDKDLRPPVTRHLVLVLIALVVSVPLLAFMLARLYGPPLERNAYADLQAIAELKAGQIEAWLAERRADGVMLAGNEGFVESVAALRRGDLSQRDKIRSHFEAIRQASGYDAILLLDPQGQPLLALGEHASAATQALLATALASGEVQRGELWRDATGRFHLDYVVPLLRSSATGREAVGGVVLHVDPQRFLFPYLQRWPGVSASGETLLVRREGESAIFLNTLRHRQGTALTLGVPLHGSQPPVAVVVLSDKPGTLQGRDYRGVPVLAAYRPVQGTAWHLVAKLDRDEVMAPLHELVWWVSLVALLGVAAVSVALLLLWHQQQRAHRLALQARESRLLRHFYDLPFIGMAVTSPSSKRWLKFNDRLCEMFGYTREELAAKNWAEMTHPEDLDGDLAEFERVLRGESEGYAMDKRFIRKDGAVVYVSMDVKCVRNANGTVDYFVTMLSDITARRAAEAKIRRMTSLYAALSQCNQAIVRAGSEAELFPQVCRDAIEFGGMKMAWIGMIDAASKAVSPVASFGAGTDYLDGLSISVDADAATGRGPTGIALSEDHPFWCQDFIHDPRTAPWHELGASHGWAASAALPLHRGGKVVGSFNLYASEINAFDEAAQNLLTEMALDISYALDNFEREAERRRAAAQLALAAKVFEQSSEGISITDADCNIVTVNQAFTTITGYSEAEVLGRNPRILASGRHDKDFYRVMWNAINTGGSWEGEIWNRRKDGSVFPEWLSISRVLDSDGRVTEYIGIFSDITEHKKAEEDILRLAHFDALTGLPNRALLNDRVSHALSIAQRSQKPMAVLFLDLDHFKNINDTLGHHVGDELLVEMAKRLQSLVREEDTVSRLGGDEFVLLLPTSDVAGAAHVAEKLLETVARRYEHEQHELVITASIGIAMYPEDGEDFEALAKYADMAMYRAKHDGRNRYRFFTQEMQARSSRNLQLENALRRALERGQLQLHYQPQIAVGNGRVIGVEALLRWTHPELGNVSPAEFVPIAEDSGQIAAIGEWVLRTAVRQMRTWMDRGIAPMIVAVNLSAVQFRQPSLPELVTRIVTEENLPPQYLELELTEGVAMDDPLAAIAVMNELHRRGIRMSIDDFGTGYSSLSYLKRFKVYKLKIDQSFVRNLTKDPEDKAIVNAVISLAKSLGLQTIAEGVETEAQLAFLREQGCHEIQGYYYSKPLPPDQLEVFVTGRAGLEQTF